MADTSKITISGNVVIASGTVVVPPGSSLTITPLPAGSSPLTFQIGFETNASLPSQITSELIGNNLIKLTVRNFDSPSGTALIQPMRVGTIANRPLFINIATHRIGVENWVRTFSYTFTLEGASDVG